MNNRVRRNEGGVTEFAEKIFCSCPVQESPEDKTGMRAPYSVSVHTGYIILEEAGLSMLQISNV